MGATSTAMILCAGLGTRLRPLTERLAKPMVPVGDAPAVAHVAGRVRLAASRIVINVHHRPGDLRPWAEREGIDVAYEPELLGTAGGVENAAPLLGAGAVLVWNGDILSNALDPRDVTAAHANAEDARLATIVVIERPAGAGNVGLGDDGNIVRLRRQSFGHESRGADFLGIHVIGTELRALLPKRGCLVGDVYIPALGRGARLAAHVTTASFTDVGSIPEYLDANAAWLAARGLVSWAHPTARVNAAIDGSVIGAGAIVDAPALRSVVWPGAHVQNACKGEVVTR